MARDLMTNPTTPEDKVNAILERFAEWTIQNVEHGIYIPLTSPEARTALLALLNEARAEEFSHYWRAFEHHHIWDSSEIVDVLTKRNISNAATPKEGQ